MKAPIVFTSAEQKANRGDWDTLSTENTYNNHSRPTYCTAKYASRGLWFLNSSPVVSRCTVRDCRGDGLAVDKSAASGFRCARGPSPRLKGNIITGNSTGILLDHASGAVPENGVLRDNKRDAVEAKPKIPVR